MIELGALYLWVRIFVWMIIALLAMFGLAVICGVALAVIDKRKPEERNVTP